MHKLNLEGISRDYSLHAFEAKTEINEAKRECQNATCDGEQRLLYLQV